MKGSLWYCPIRLHTSFKFNALENLCTQKLQSSRGGCSRPVHKMVYLALYKGNILINILFLKNIHREIPSLINQAMYLFNKKIVG